MVGAFKLYQSFLVKGSTLKKKKETKRESVSLLHARAQTNQPERSHTKKKKELRRQRVFTIVGEETQPARTNALLPCARLSHLRPRIQHAREGMNSLSPYGRTGFFSHLHLLLSSLLSLGDSLVLSYGHGDSCIWSWSSVVRFTSEFYVCQVSVK